MSFNYSAEYWPVCEYEEITQGQGETHPKGLEGTVLRDQTQTRIVSISPSQSRKSKTSVG